MHGLTKISTIYRLNIINLFYNTPILLPSWQSSPWRTLLIKCSPPTQVASQGIQNSSAKKLKTVFPHIRPAGIIFLIVYYSKVTVHKAKGHST